MSKSRTERVISSSTGISVRRESLAREAMPQFGMNPVTDKDIEDIDPELDALLEDRLFHRSCYLAGPMTGYNESNFPAFNRAAADLRSRGWKVFNPAEQGESQSDDDYKRFMSEDLAQVCLSDAVIVLPDWETSKGATLEVHVAQVLDIPVLEYGPDGRLFEVDQPNVPAIFDLTTDELIEDAHAEIPAARTALKRALEAYERGETVCQEADRLVSNDRQGTYGHPLDDFGKVTGMAHALWGRGPEAPEEHALYMILVKLARLANTPGHHDSIVDICGYAKTYDMVLEERERRLLAS